MLGKERGECHSFDVDAPIERVKASLTNDRKYIDAIAFLRDGEVNFDDYGEVNQPLKRWNLPEDKPVIGYFGKINQDDKRIKQLGWVLLDSACQEAKEALEPSEPVTPVEPEPVTPV